MKKIEADSPEAQSANNVADHLAQLKAMFSELVTEGANGATINVDVLKALIGDQTVTDADEKYGLNWHGKRKARQIPEPTGKEPCKSICDITKQRLRKAGEKISSTTGLIKPDLGFRVFKLDTSNIRSWNPKVNDLKTSLFDHLEHLEPSRSSDDILYEILLKMDLDLCVPIEKRDIAGKTVHSIGGGTLLACLDEQIKVTDAETLALGMAAWWVEQGTAGDTTAVFRDSAFENDVAKSNLAAILEQHGVKQVRSM